MIKWDTLSYKQLETLIDDNSVIILPVGSIEAHGPHLPLNTDVIQPLYIAEQLSDKLGCIVLPPIYYGWTKTLSSFKGTISLRFDTLKMLVYDILKSVVDNGVKNIVILSGHANTLHMSALTLAAEAIIDTYPVKIMVLSDYDIAYEYRGVFVPETDSHGGILETSRIMAIAPEYVNTNLQYHKLKDKNRFMIIKNIRDYYPYGTLSNPKGANAELGKKINNIIVTKLAELIRQNFNLDK